MSLHIRHATLADFEAIHRIEGTHRRYAFRDGQYVDAHTMARLHPPRAPGPP